MRCKKMEISLRSHAIKQTMLNVASEKGLLTKNTHFSNGFCKFQVAISGAKRVHRGIIGRLKRHIFHDFAFVPLSKSCFPPRARSRFSENRMIFCKKRCSKHGRHKENSTSHTKVTKLLQRCIHSFLLTGLWGRKMHGTAARSNILMRAWSEQIAIGMGKRAKRANTITKNALLEAVWRSKK